ncbi:MAG: hypothetical protein DMF14_06050 [Verrucomicrobia bacterium]|nr:MAG: hypothetical protein DMF14_06050 [Verrucomicrobiota bacterium]
MSFIRTGLRELGLKVRRQRTRLALRHVKRQLQRSEIYLGREGTAQAASFPEVRNEIVALKKLEQEQKEVAMRIAQIEVALKQIEAERAENAGAQNDAIAKLEAKKKPILQQRDDAKNAATLCERELASVESRLQANDSADRELLKQLSALQAQVPPPADLDARTATLASKRARLPQERAEIVRAREGSAEACRQATQKLAAAEEELSATERNITRVRERFEATDRALAEKVRARQDALRDARAQHQTVEERKNPAYLNIGRHLATRGIAPPNAPHLLHDVLRHRQSVQRHHEHREQLSVLSAQIDKQELRKFYFVIASILILLAIVLPLVFQSPPKREWLPRETDAILSLNAEHFDRDDLPKKWRNEDFWLQTWPGLIGAAAQTPRLRIPGDAARVTRALTTAENSPPREFLLVEARDNVSTVVRTIAEDKQFERRTISGLPVWQRSDFSIARVGPKTLAVGMPDGVDELVRVRLGLEADLQITGEFFDRFQALDRETTLRLISRDPPGLARAFHPIFPRELLESAQLLGLGVSLQTPAKARLLLRLPSENAASDLAKSIHDDPQRWLRIEQSDLPLFAAPPEINRQHVDLEIRFNIPENSARLLLQRIAKTDAPPAATAAN